jgi:hypothetical protein
MSEESPEYIKQNLMPPTPKKLNFKKGTRRIVTLISIIAGLFGAMNGYDEADRDYRNELNTRQSHNPTLYPEWCEPEAPPFPLPPGFKEVKTPGWFKEDLSPPHKREKDTSPNESGTHGTFVFPPLRFKWWLIPLFACALFGGIWLIYGIIYISGSYVYRGFKGNPPTL